jgi:hypothetical protein
VTRLFVDRLNAAIQGTLDRPQAIAETVVVLNTQFTEIPESVRDQVPRNNGGLLRSQPVRTIPRRAITKLMILILAFILSLSVSQLELFIVFKDGILW